MAKSQQAMSIRYITLGYISQMEYIILRNDMNIISSISVTDIVLMIIWGNEIIELFPK